MNEKQVTQTLNNVLYNFRKKASASKTAYYGLETLFGGLGSGLSGLGYGVGSGIGGLGDVTSGIGEGIDYAGEGINSAGNSVIEGLDSAGDAVKGIGPASTDAIHSVGRLFPGAYPVLGGLAGGYLGLRKLIPWLQKKKIESEGVPLREVRRITSPWALGSDSSKAASVKTGGVPIGTNHIQSLRDQARQKQYRQVNRAPWGNIAKKVLPTAIGAGITGLALKAPGVLSAIGSTLTSGPISPLLSLGLMGYGGYRLGKKYLPKIRDYFRQSSDKMHGRPYQSAIDSAVPSSVIQKTLRSRTADKLGKPGEYLPPNISDPLQNVSSKSLRLAARRRQS